MKRLSRNSQSVWYFMIAAGALALGVACQPVVIQVQEVIQTHSCTDDAVAMQVSVAASGAFSDVNFEGGSPNVLGDPLLLPEGSSLLIVADLDDADTGEEVTLRYNAKVIVPATLVLSTTDIEFYKTPWSEGNPPDCSPANGPSFELSMDPLHDLFLRVRNPGPLPLTIVMLELVETSLLPSSSLDWENPEFNALPWQTAVMGGTVLDVGAPPLEVDLPDEATEGRAALCRVISLYDGHELRGILQADLTGEPVAAQPTTWGAVKALFRK